MTTPITETAAIDARIEKLRGELAALETRRAELKTEIAAKWGSDTTPQQTQAAGIVFKIEAGQQVLAQLEAQRVLAVKTDTSASLRRAYAVEQERAQAVEAQAEKIMKTFAALSVQMRQFWNVQDAFNDAHGQTAAIRSEAIYSRTLTSQDAQHIAPEYGAAPTLARDFSELEAFCAQNLTID